MERMETLCSIYFAGVCTFSLIFLIEKVLYKRIFHIEAIFI